MAKLVLSRDGAIAAQRFLDATPLTIGRDPASDIVVDDARIAAVQARVVAVGHDYILEAVVGGSITVNGSPCARRILQHGDVADLADYRLKYVDARASSPIDLERTMLIPGLARVVGEEGAAPPPAVPSSRSANTRFPVGRIEWLAGAHRGSQRTLDRVVDTFGTPGIGVVVVTRRPHGFFATHVEGEDFPRVNGRSLGTEPCALASGDVIEVAGETLRFTQL